MKYWFLDLDGTLNKKSIDYLNNNNNGDVFTLATGRGYADATKLAGKEFISRLKIPMVLEGGGRITDLHGKDFLRHPLFKNEILESFDRATKEYKKNNLRYVGGCELNSKKYNFFAVNQEVAEDLAKDYPKHCVEFFKSIDCLRESFIKNGCVKLEFDVKIRKKSDFKNTNFVESDSIGKVSKNISKGSGVLSIANHFGIPLHLIAIAGNDINDISMFKLPVAIKISVGSKCPEIRELSTHHISSENELIPLLDLLTHQK